MGKTKRHIREIHRVEDYGRLPRRTRLPEFDATLLEKHHVDSHWAVLEANGVTARCSAWWQDTPFVVRGKTGLIGHYSADDNESANALLQVACQRLIAQGCTFVIGPMDQNTWRDYRFVVEAGDRPQFFLEPTSHHKWVDQFRCNGFTEIARYTSSFVDDLTLSSPKLSLARARLTRLGIRMRPLDRARLKAELKRIYAVVRGAFQKNPFHVSLSEADFLDMYHPLEHLIPTDLILLAERDDHVVGFVFALPDLLQLQRGRPMDTVVVKTLGVLPDRCYAGLGQLLLEEVHHRAARMGYRNAIHALVRDAKHLNAITGRYGQPFRRYALFGKELA